MIRTEQMREELLNPSAHATRVGYAHSLCRTFEIFTDGGVQIKTPGFSFLFILVPQDPSLGTYKLKTYVKPRNSLNIFREIQVEEDLLNQAWQRFFPIWKSEQ